jgi:hypothetical protein
MLYPSIRCCPRQTSGGEETYFHSAIDQSPISNCLVEKDKTEITYSTTKIETLPRCPLFPKIDKTDGFLHISEVDVIPVIPIINNGLSVSYQSQSGRGREGELGGGEK